MNEREEEEEKEEESLKTAEEEKLKRDALDDLYTSLASSEMYNSRLKPLENTTRVINTFALVINFFFDGKKPV